MARALTSRARKLERFRDAGLRGSVPRSPKLARANRCRVARADA